MKIEELKGMVSKAGELYDKDNSWVSDFEDWVKSLNGVERKVAMHLYQEITRRNQRPSTFIWRFNPYLEQELLDSLSSYHQ